MYRAIPTSFCRRLIGRATAPGLLALALLRAPRS
jgi:hypothetical protein